MGNWDKKFIELAKHISTWSKDKSTQVGCVIVDDNHRIISVGYNGFPSGFNDDFEERHERPAKYFYTEHSERNAIYNASRAGVSTKGCTLYVTPLFPCADCARAIIQSGIKKVVCYKPDLEHPIWGESFKKSLEMLFECNIEIFYIDTFQYHFIPRV